MDEKNNVGGELSVCGLLNGEQMPTIDAKSQCLLKRYPVQEGIELIVWSSDFYRSRIFYLYDDSTRINFSCVLSGTSRIVPDVRQPNNQCLLEMGAYYISHTPGCHGKAYYTGKFESITLSVRPDILINQVASAHTIITQCSAAQRYCQRNTYSAEIHSAAQMLWNALVQADDHHDSELTTLWVQGQCLVMLSLMLDKHLAAGRCADGLLRQPDRQKLIKAKALLLSDLTKAPTISELARETGLSALKVKRGFRAMFHNSVYGVFQAERMQEARRRLLCDNVSVMTVASDLGYANASHFSAAFQKQFGVLPSVLKRSLRVNGIARV